MGSRLLMNTSHFLRERSGGGVGDRNSATKERLIAIARESLRKGEHLGDCTNKENPWDGSCEIHLEVSKVRSEWLVTALQEAELMIEVDLG
jgi:hypothetical protein